MNKKREYVISVLENELLFLKNSKDNILLHGKNTLYDTIIERTDKKIIEVKEVLEFLKSQGE
jgi:hypothetical protein